MDEFKVDRIGNRSFRISLGDESVTVRSDDPDEAIARGIEVLSGVTGFNIIATKPGDKVIQVPQFTGEYEAPTPKANVKAKKG